MRLRNQPLLTFYATRTPSPRYRRGDLRIQFPTSFSIIDDPDAALDVFGTLVALGSREKRSRYEPIVLDQSRCAVIDLGAEAIASALGLELIRKHGRQFAGYYPANEIMHQMVVAAGFARFVGRSNVSGSDYHTFDLRRCKRQTAKTAELSSFGEIESTHLTEYVNRCLREYRYEMNVSAKRRLASLVSEVMENADNHSGRSEWWVCGHLLQPPGSSYGNCHITIFSFGDTMAESLQALPADSLLRRNIEALVAEHTKRGFFSFGPTWTPENLWTLYALQEGVSRLNIAPTAGDRGRGTADMIEFFQRLGQSESAGSPPQMCVLSGSTHILFDGKYRMRSERTASGEERRVIAFNGENDLTQRPDDRYVRNLRGFFPGTAVSMRFYLDSDHLEAISGDDGGSSDQSR